jgi:hypothetical protein
MEKYAYLIRLIDSGNNYINEYSVAIAHWRVPRTPFREYELDMNFIFKEHLPLPSFVLDFQTNLARPLETALVSQYPFDGCRLVLTSSPRQANS